MNVEEGKPKVVPFRLSYHGRGHYDTVVPQEWCVADSFYESNPGAVEEEAIQWAIEHKK